ncbi:MAG TPA: ribonuclease H-like domain-containing protein [Syntrophales bacterium]|nr:ribonuclease H-like domain-containing protein [Syntrophales bacterium]
MKNAGVVDRLRRITGEDKKETQKTARSAEISELRRRIESIMVRRPQESQALTKKYPPLNTLINGDAITTAQGAFFLATERRNAHHFHGTRSVGELVKLNMQAAALLANNQEIARFHISEGLFLDTETTGLSGGTGTLAFMIGVGRFEKDAFITDQIFIRDFSEERAALQYLTDIVRKKQFLVSFNGKAFDLNLLSTRYILNKLRNPLDNLQHLDLLFPSRRLCGHRLENSRLVTLEQALFGVYRDDDILGMEIPERYFSWLRRRDPQLVVDIFKHNHLDILSLAVLTVHLSELIVPDAAIPVTHDPRDLLAAARLLQDRNENALATRILHDLTDCNHASVRFESQKMLSLMLKRNGDWENASCLWETMIRENPANHFAAVELAKWYEHGCRNFTVAYNIVSKVLDGSKSLNDDTRDALLHRLKRLQSRFPC